MRGGRAERGGPPRVLVVDVGSTSARCRLYDASARGHDPGPGSRAVYRWDGRGGAMERDASDLLARVASTIDAGVARARGEGVEIAAVAVTTFWHSLVGVDQRGVPLTPLTGWGDMRAAATAARLRAEVDAEALHRRTGCFLHPSYPMVRLAWMREREPESSARVTAWLSFGELLEQQIFGVRRCSLSIASGSGLLDGSRLAWDAEARALAGIGEEHLSPLVDLDEPLRGLLAPWDERWPELATVPWFPAVGDGACANLGSGAVGPDRLGITIGTSAAVRVLLDDVPDFEVPPDLWVYRLDGRRRVVGGALSNGGNALGFLREQLRIPSGVEWDEILDAPGAAEHGLTVLPSLVDERGPGGGADPGGSIVGLRLDTTPAQVARAWVEAIGYRIAGVCARLERHFGARSAPRASGGALHGSRAWAQILADILDRTLVLPAEREETSRGAALLALEALGVLANGDAGDPPVAEEYRPDPAAHARHRLAMARQHQLERLLGAFEPGGRSAADDDLPEHP